MQREVHFRRDQENIRNTTSATTHTQFAEHAVYQQDLAMAGADGGAQLANSMAQFFNLGGKTLEMMEQLDHKREVVEIGYRNEDQKLQARADALAGKEEDPTLKGDRDYTQTYHITQGQRDGYRLLTDWQKRVDGLAWDADYKKEMETFLEKEFGKGTQSEAYNAAALSTFKQATDPQLIAWNTNKINKQDTLDRQKVDEVMGNDIALNKLDPDRMSHYESMLAGPMRKNPEAIKPYIMDKIVGAATATNAPAIDKFLQDTGYAQQFPQMYQQMQEKLTGKFVNGMNIEGSKAWGDIHISLSQDEKLLEDPALLRETGMKIFETNSKYGNQHQFQSALIKLNNIHDRVTKATAGFNAFAVKMANPDTFYYWEPKEVNAFQFKFLTVQGIDPLASPEMASRAAAVVSQNRSVATDLGTNLKQAILDKTNQTAQMNAFTFWQGLENSGRVQIKQEMGDEAYTQYTLMKGLSGGNNAKLGNALSQILANPELGKLPTNPGEFRWNDLYGEPTKKPHEMMLEAKKDVAKGFAKTFGETNIFGSGKPDNIVMSGAVEEGLLASYGRNLSLMTQAKIPDAKEKALEATLSDVGSKYMLFPRGDGKVVVGENILPQGAVVPTQKHMALLKEDLKGLSGVVPGLFKDSDKFALEIDRGESERTRKTGSFNILKDNQIVLLTPGQEVALGKGTTNLTGTDPSLPKGVSRLSTNPQEAKKELDAMLPKGVEAIPWTVNGKTVFKLGYTFRDYEKTVAELSQEYASKKDARAKEKLDAIKAAGRPFGAGAFGNWN